MSRYAVAAATALLLAPALGHAQTTQPGWFVPSQSAPRAASGSSKSHHAQKYAPVNLPAMPPAPTDPKPDATASAAAQAQANAPIPALPPLSKGDAAPVPSIGVIGVPDVLQGSTAAQAVDKEIQARRAALTKEAQAEQDVWRRTQAILADPRAHLPPDELRAREMALQQRVANSQIVFRNHEARIQAAAQVALGQIERTLIAVIRQVAQSRGMNLVLHRAQVALNMNAFDISDEVTKELNLVLPSVAVAPDAAFANVTAASMQAQQAQQGQQGQ
jgi:Skp family chaperone for outer membrane proteins